MQCVVQDLGSLLRHVRVNGLPVVDLSLAHGDQKNEGGSVFLFLQDELTATFPNPVELSESATGLGGGHHPAPARRLRRYPHPEALAHLLTGDQIPRDYKRYLKSPHGLGSIRNLESLQRQPLGMIFERRPAPGADIEDHAEQLPLQRFEVADRADGRGDFK